MNDNKKTELEDRLKDLRNEARFFKGKCEICSNNDASDVLTWKLQSIGIKHICRDCAYKVNEEFKEIQNRQSVERDFLTKGFIGRLIAAAKSNKPQVEEKDLLENEKSG